MLLILGKIGNIFYLFTFQIEILHLNFELDDSVPAHPNFNYFCNYFDPQ